MTNKIQFKIVINKEYKIKCSYIDSQKNEIPIHLTNKNKDKKEDYLPISISFHDNKIILCEENTFNIHFINDLFDQPNDFKLYEINYQHKDYKVIAEVLFALIINEFKEQIEKEFIIENTIVELPVQNRFLNSRIITALDSIGLQQIQLDEEEIEYQYKEQGDILQEILTKKLEYSKRERMIEKANAIAKEQNMKEIQISSESLATEQEFQKALTKYTIKERDQLHLYDLDNYCIFIASRYLNSIYDHMNLTKVCKRLKYNMDKFHYNPVSVTPKNIKFFPNIQTLHRYGNIDQYLEGGRIIQYVDWRKLRLCQLEKIKKENSGKVIEFKHVMFTHEDAEENKKRIK